MYSIRGRFIFMVYGIRIENLFLIGKLVGLSTQGIFIEYTNFELD